jgi:hypothetical protein
LLDMKTRWQMYPRAVEIISSEDTNEYKSKGRGIPPIVYTWSGKCCIGYIDRRSDNNFLCWLWSAWYFLSNRGLTVQRLE